MSELAIIDSDAFDKIKRVADLYVDGVTSPYTIARRLNIKVVEARQAIDQWHEVLRNDQESRDAARDALNVMVQRYDLLLTEANRNLQDLKSLTFDSDVASKINATIKLIGELDAKRVDLLQKAGLLDAHDLGDELAEREERETILINILRNHLCEDCKVEVAHQLGKVTGQVESVRVD